MNATKPILTRTTKADIAYVSDRAVDRGRLRGHEEISLSTFSDGTKTLRVSCLINDPPHVVRDVIQTVDKHLRPLDCFVRVRTADTFTGTGWFRWHQNTAECESFTAAEGRQTQTMPCGEGPVVFCNHAIVGDAWMTAGYPQHQGPGLFVIENMLSASPHTQGATGPKLHTLRLGIEFIGPETITVAAGTFATKHYRLGTLGASEELKQGTLNYETWVLDDGSYIPALSQYAGDRRYELMTYATTNGTS